MNTQKSESVFDVKDVNYVGVPSGILYSDKKLENITVYDLVNEVNENDDYPIHSYKYKYEIKSSDSSISIDGKYIGLFHNGQYYTPLNN